MSAALAHAMMVHPGWALLVSFLLLATVVKAIYALCNDVVRHLNIRAAGWPPPHLDADGDLKPPPDDEEVA